jgi:hypothetical protein
MAIDGSEGRSADKGSGMARHNVNMCVWISVLLGEAKIYQVDDVGVISDANQYISGLQVPVNEVASMNMLKTTNLDSIRYYTMRVKVLFERLANWSAINAIVLRLKER